MEETPITEPTTPDANAATTTTPADAGAAAPASAPADDTGSLPADGLNGSGADDQGKKPDVAPDDKPNEWIGAPEGNYSDEGIDLPPGFTNDPTVMSGLAEVCGEMGLSQKSFATIVSRMTPVLAKAQDAEVQRFKEDNLKAAYGDKDLGGANWKSTMDTANAAYNKLTTPALREILERSGLNCHPDMIRLFHSLGKQLSDDAALRGRPSANRNPLAGFYDNSNMN